MSDGGEELFAIHTHQPGEGLVFSPDNSGWARYSSPSYPENSQVFLRFARSDNETVFVVREIHFAFFAGLGTRSLRDVPLGRLEAEVNQPDHYEELARRVSPTDAVVVPFPDNVFTKAEWPWHMYTIPQPPELKLEIPTDQHRKPDEFYQQVAKVFAYLATVSSRPAGDLAEANDVPVTTIHGWVREARRRGLLPAGERSRKSKP